jgi:ectoine hydroxylase-related dioxygenase (phytanoyl-CoA dioxygenase family)
MPEGSIREAITRQGWAVIPGVLDAAEMMVLRVACERLLPDSRVELLASSFLANPGLVSVLFRDVIVAALVDAVGSGFSLFPNFTVRADIHAPWHFDAGFLRAPGGGRSDFVQCSVYLQDNDAIEGGGLDVVPRSHQLASVDELRVDEVIRMIRERQMLPTHAGDMLVWDARLLHRGTPASSQSARRKFGIHWTASRADADAETFLRHLVSRSVVEIDGEVQPVPRYAEIAEIRYPTDYPPQVVASVGRWGLRVASLQ